MYEVLKLTGFLSTLIIFIGLPNESIAQDDFQEGYVVTNSNDTLYGLIRDRKIGAFGKLFKKIRFKGRLGKSKYAPKEIISYKKGEATFETLQLISTGHFFNEEYQVSTNGDFRFLKVVERGYLNYYLLEYEDADSGYIDSTAFLKKRNEYVLVRVNQGLFGLKRKKLAIFFSDYPELANRILNKRVKHPIEIVSIYNKWKTENP